MFNFPQTLHSHQSCRLCDCALTPTSSSNWKRMVQTGLPPFLWFWDKQAKQEMFHLCVVCLTMFVTKTFTTCRMELKPKRNDSLLSAIWSPEETILPMLPISSSTSPNQGNYPGGFSVELHAKRQLNCVNFVGAGLRMVIHASKLIQIVYLLQHQILRMLTHWSRDKMATISQTTV